MNSNSKQDASLSCETDIILVLLCAAHGTGASLQAQKALTSRIDDVSQDLQSTHTEPLIVGVQPGQ